MISKEIIEIIKLVAKEKLIRNIAIFVTLSTVIIGVFFNWLSALVIYLSYILGYIVAWLLIKYRNKTTVFFQRLNSFYRDRFSIKKTVKNSCSICDNLSCRRHQQNASLTPWKHLYIAKDLNSSIEHFYESIIENFINSWYRTFTDDTDFTNELRYCLRYASAMIINRFLELDIADIIANKLVPCAVKHVDDYLYMQQIGKLKNLRFNEVVVEYLGKRLHVAAANRKTELEYLQHLVAAILTNVLPDNYIKCRNYSVIMREILAGWVFLPLMDVLADPNHINYLVILCATYKAKKTGSIKANTETVEFLHNYVSINKKTSSFATNLNKIKNNTDLLYALMQFLKKQDHVNLLQFCLDVDDFNAKLLTPDLSPKQLEDLHADIKRLYGEYIDQNSFNYINCPSSISLDFHYLMQHIYSLGNLTKLSKLLYKAYDHTFSTLENFWLPQFFHSNEFYAHICGSKVVSTYNKQSVNKAKKYYDSTNQSTVAKLSSGIGKIKGVLKNTQAVEGSLYPFEPQNVDNTTVDDILLAECKTLFRDLNTWKISIPSYKASPSNKVIYFYINVERSDILSDDSKKNWVVLRKDQDFYTLKSKLVEFHGESEICDSPLPSRKAGSSVDNRMSKYEDFLRKLLSKPTLRGSDLLHSFLTTEDDFTMYITTNASNIQDIGNIYQSVAYKLRKEKGQHLDSFMASFINSVVEPTSEKLEWAEVGEALDTLLTNSRDKTPLPKTYRNYVFNDNFGIQHKTLKDTNRGSFNPDSFIECVFYLLKHIFKVPTGFLKLYASICMVAQNLVDLTSRFIIERKLRAGLCQSNLAYLIGLLEYVVFVGYEPQSKEVLEKQKVKAFHELSQAWPPLVKRIFGSGVNDGSKVLLEILQHPHYNKQLAYNLLDIVLVEMYPMLEKNEEYY